MTAYRLNFNIAKVYMLLPVIFYMIQIFLKTNKKKCTFFALKKNMQVGRSAIL